MQCACVLDISSGSTSFLVGHTRTVYSVAYSKTRNILFTGSYDKTIIVWDGTSYQKLHQLDGHTWCIFCLALCEEETINEKDLLFSGSGDHTVKVWSLKSWSCIATLECTYDVRALCVYRTC